VIGAVVKLGVVEREVLATVVLDAPIEQPADDVVRLGKALVPERALSEAGRAADTVHDPEERRLIPGQRS